MKAEQEEKTLEEQNLDNIVEDMRRAWKRALAEQEAFTRDNNGEQLKDVSPKLVTDLYMQTIFTYAAYQEALELQAKTAKEKRRREAKGK